MDQYLVIKHVVLQVKEKEFRKDRIITLEDVGQNNINRYLEKGYIKLIGNKDINTPKAETPSKNFLTVDEIDKLKKPELLEYANKIGITNIKSSSSEINLKATINQFIKELTDTEEDIDEESEV